MLYDLLGLDERFNPRFLKKYMDLSTEVTAALGRYRDEVREGSFPAAGHCFGLDEGEGQ